MHCTIDRIEGGFAICELPERDMLELPLFLLPAGVKEGDILVYAAEGWQLDQDATEARQQRIAAKFEALRQKHPQ